ncbi:MAG: hypothetical protein M1812_002520 [Candelaria pacifica]|nr:MAG: hypothetical protein M1812_002520 [Candelaria pacifica]
MAEATNPANVGEAPGAGRAVSHNGKEYTTVKEGLAYILVPKGAPSSTDPKKAKTGGLQAQSVFYNPIQQFNRDLSVLAIRAYGEEIVAERREKHSRAPQKKTQGERKKGTEKESGNSYINNEGISDQIVNGDGTRALTSEQLRQCEGNSAPNGHQKEPAQSDQSGKMEGTEAPRGGEKRKRDTEEAEPEASAKRLKQAAQDMGGNIPTTGPQDTQRISPTTVTKSTNADSITITSDQVGPDPISEPKTTADKANATSDEWKPSFSILDALSATGLRALRYAQEISSVTLVTANDLLPTATASIKLNVQHNHLEGKIIPITGNALAHMYSVLDGSSLPRLGQQFFRGKYDVIDLDPYGTAAPFLDAAVQALNNGGLLCVTCTDAGVFASSGYPEKTYALYGGLPIKGPQSHEGGLRLILHAIATSAARYGLAIEPLLSLSIDFYARLFVCVRKSAAEVKFLAGKTMVVYNCDEGCGAWTTQLLARNREEKDKIGETFHKHGLMQAPSASERCEHCSFKTHLAGPMYAGPLHSPAFIQRILELLPDLDKETYTTISRIEGMLTTAQEETLTSRKTSANDETEKVKAVTSRSLAAVVDHYPFFFIPHALSRVIHCQTPSENALRGAFKHLGYRVTRSHTKPGSIKTDAPWSVIWEVMREWSRQKSPVDPDAIKEGTAGWGVMQRVSKTKDVEEAQDEAEAPIEAAAAQNQASTVEQSGAANADSSHDTSPSQGKLKVIFDEKLGKQTNVKKLVRYQLNPRANWGPMNRAKGGQNE